MNPKIPLKSKILFLWSYTLFSAPFSITNHLLFIFLKRKEKNVYYSSVWNFEVNNETFYTYFGMSW